MPTIKLGPNFFKSEIRSYGNHKVDFFRELFQNSVDANSSRIDVNVEGSSHGCVISFKDNGCGMSRDVLENVYFRLGETTKHDSSTTGGFGRARVLTMFAQDLYEIYTSDVMVSGKGAEYEIHEHPHTKGFHAKIHTDPDWSETSMKAAIRDYLSASNIECDVFVNGEIWNAWEKNGRFVQQIGHWGNVYMKNSDKPELLVRVRGALMFRTWIKAKKKVIVELNPETSREVLTSTRDYLQYGYMSDLQELLHRINTNSRALKERQSKSLFYEGRKGTFFSPNKYLEKIQKSSALNNNEIVEEHSINKEVGTYLPPLPKVNSNETIESFYRELKTSIPNILIHDETSNEKIRARIGQYDPNVWDLEGIYSHTNRKGANIYKLLRVWQIAISECIECLFQSPTGKYLNGVSWGIGFVFSDDALAIHYPRNGLNYILLNPVDSDGKMKYKITQKGDLIRLLAIAKHEVAHIVASDHDEDYATTLTDIDMLLDQSKALRAMKDS